MTLFTNVLQNPQDARTRSDIRLMHQVVSFLSSIAIEEETGGVKRMLEVCVEFERIAKIVVDKSDKEAHSRRKRKAPPEDDPQPEEVRQGVPPSEKPPTPQPTPPKSIQTPTLSHSLTPGFSGDLSRASFSPPPSGFSPPPNNMILPNYVPQPGDFPNMFTEFSDINQFGSAGVASPGMSNFQQFSAVGQDMWQMPMSSDWDGTWNLQEGFVGPSAGGSAGLQESHHNGIRNAPTHGL
jgi:hypothetical protein